MTYKRKEQIFQRAIAKWGIGAQLGMLLEEAIELALAVRKYLGRDQSVQRFDDVCEEIADVEIMVEQFEMMYPGSREVIDRFKEEKIKRLEERLNKSKF